MNDVTKRILSMVAYREHCDLMDLPPIYDAVDPDALDEVVEEQAVTKVEFTYSGYHVTVAQNGSVQITPKTAAD